MKGRSFTKAIVQLHRGEKGITGLETAIILIAFVTVAAVLAYSVLSAGIFSSEKGQEAVYSGLQASQASMQVAGNVYAIGVVNATVPANSTVNNVSFQLKSILSSEKVDLGKCIVNYADPAGKVYGIQGNVSGFNVTGFDGMLDANQVVDIWVNLSIRDLEPYEKFNIEIIPATGASINVEKTIPGEIDAVMNLH